jgi:hypothetical protein
MRENITLKEYEAYMKRLFAVTEETKTEYTHQDDGQGGVYLMKNGQCCGWMGPKALKQLEKYFNPKR